MERILLVEDNKSLSKLIAKKISTELPFEVDIALTYGEAQLFMRKYDYFLALLDLNLPDAPNGEIVDYVLENKIPIIVLSANMDKAFRKEVLAKDIIDYVSKGGVEDINYIIHTIDRVSKNRKYKVMIVDDSMVFRNKLQKMVENLFFKVVAVGHGEEALNMLKEYPDIRVIMTDYSMPVMDGLELTKEARKLYNKSELSILAISSIDDEETSAMFLKNGANDFIKKPFSKEEFSCRINNAVEALENIDAITNHAKRDFLTGLYNRRYFFKSMREYFDKGVSLDCSFSIAMINIDNFKKINDTYGSDVGDAVIIYLSELLRANTKESDMVARFGAEEFCVLLKDVSSEMAYKILEKLRHKIEVSPYYIDDEHEVNFTVSIGATSQYENSLEEMVNEADMMLLTAKNGGKNRVVFEGF